MVVVVVVVVVHKLRGQTLKPSKFGDHSWNIPRNSSRRLPRKLEVWDLCTSSHGHRTQATGPRSALPIVCSQLEG